MSSDNNQQDDREPVSAGEAGKKPLPHGNTAQSGTGGAAMQSENSPNDHGPNAHAPKSRLRTWFHYFAYTAIAVLSVLVDPFNWTETTSKLSQDNWLSNRVFETYHNFLDVACDAWNNLIDQPRKIMSIGLRQWAHNGQSL